MNNIKWYYQAQSQKELDYLIEYIQNNTQFRYHEYSIKDYDRGFEFIGIDKKSGLIDCTANPSILQGELTTDIEVFKAQFKTEPETKADLIAKRDALNERIA